MFENLLKKVARELKKASVPYMVIGSQAVLLCSFDGEDFCSK